MNDTTPVEFPFRVESETDLASDPVAGTYGTKVSIVQETCPECGYDRARVAELVLPGVHSVTCNACGFTIEQG